MRPDVEEHDQPDVVVHNIVLQGGKTICIANELRCQKEAR